MQASSASISDDILIRANIRALYRSKYHCTKEMQEYISRINNPSSKPEYTASLKEKIALRGKVKGCGYVINRLVDRIESYEFYTCLCKLTHPLIDTLMHLTDSFERGILPFFGGLLDQPSQIIELIKITQDAKMKEQHERDRQQANKQKGAVNVTTNRH